MHITYVIYQGREWIGVADSHGEALDVYESWRTKSANALGIKPSTRHKRILRRIGRHPAMTVFLQTGVC